MHHLLIPHHLYTQTPPSQEEDPFDSLDRVKEILSDGEHPFPIERKVLKELLQHKTDRDIQRIKFLSSGTFHKAFIVEFDDGEQLVARVARRFMPRIKTESEVATLDYIRSKTNVPVPSIFHYDSSPYNEIGYEYSVMSKAPGVALTKVYRGLDMEEQRQLFSNLAQHILTLFSHRFNAIGSLYSNANPAIPPSVPQTPLGSRPGTPRPGPQRQLSIPRPAGPQRVRSTDGTDGGPTRARSQSSVPPATFMVGPIVSWPFFGAGRGVQDLDRGPWSTFEAYLRACCDREIDAVQKECEGRAASHRPHLPPEEGHSAPSSSDEEDSDDGEVYYRDYRTRQRTSLLVAHAHARVGVARQEMERFLKYMRDLGCGSLKRDQLDAYSFDLHDLSLDNIFVDEDDHTTITSIIDWESTCIRPLWQCAHLPAFLAAHPHSHEADMFREEIGKLGPLGELWLRGESERAEWRRAHKVLEWDGWEEGLIYQTLDLDEESDTPSSSGHVGTGLLRLL